MRCRATPLKALAGIGFMFGCLISQTAFAGCGGETTAPSPALKDIDVKFQLDPRVTRGVYLGDLWVSVPYVRVGEGDQVIINARAYALDSTGRKTTVSPEWIPSDRWMVSVNPSVGNEVSITVKREGESRLRIVCADLSEELIIKAKYRLGVIQVEISQAR